MIGRLRGLGFVLALVGLAFVAAGGVAFLKAQDGAKSLQAYSAVQNVQLSYNDQGQLVDRGETEEAQGILSLLKNDWGFPVVDGDLNPNDPLVNTATEYMYQMATVSYHTLHGTQTITLTEDKEFNGVTYKAGDYEFQVDGRYWTGFDRTNPIEGPARDKAWTGTALALVANLGVGTVTASALQMGFALAGLFGGVGFLALLAGLGLVWAVRPETAKVPKAAVIPQPMPA
jgi:hypothetical protein